MAHPLKTFKCRGALGTRVNPDPIGCVWTGEFDLWTRLGFKGSLPYIGLRLWWVQVVTFSSSIIMESLVSYEILL